MKHQGKKICRRSEQPNQNERIKDNGLPSDLHPVLARIYRLRNMVTAIELDQSLERLLPPTRLKDMERAVALLASMIREDKRVLIVADFDADGATSCALVVRALRQMGATDVRYVVPNRFEYGYGLTPEIVALAAQQHPDLIITVDNGISSIDGVREAHRRRIKVLITDHHLPGAALPEADAIVNPNQPDDTFPSKHLAGVGVAFYLMLALRAHLREAGWFTHRGIPEPNLGVLLDLVALGTVADLVPLDHNNRILVAQGLARINYGRAYVGIRALLRVAGRAPGRLTTSDLGFCVAPRLNAAGRLEDMSLGIECLLTDEAQPAAQMADKLDRLNRERRAIEQEMQRQAISAVTSLHMEDTGLPRGVCLFDESWHQGVIGLVASRVKEQTHRPVIAFAPISENEIKGSARSVPGLHIRDTLDTLAARHPELLQKFGGHAMAAGLTLRREHYDTFRNAFNKEVSERISEDDLQGKVMSDGELAADDLNLALAELLRNAGPWGQGFPEPVFDGCFDVVNRRVVGGKHLKLILRPANHTKTVDAIAFNAVVSGNPPSRNVAGGKRPQIHAAYRMDVNEYQGSQSLQLIIEHFEPVH